MLTLVYLVFLAHSYTGTCKHRTGKLCCDLADIYMFSMVLRVQECGVKPNEPTPLLETLFVRSVRDQDANWPVEGSSVVAEG